MKRWYIYYPLLLLALFFALDKLATLEWVQKYTQSDATFLYYDYKAELLEEFAEFEESRAAAEKPDKALVILGSSRLLYFNYPEFRRNYPDWEMFNFSAPVTVPIWYLYMFEQMVGAGVRPDLLVVEVDPYHYNRSSDVFEKSSLSYSFDISFLIRHRDLFTPDERTRVVAKSLFAGYRYPPDLEALRDRLRSPQDRFLIAFEQMDMHQRRNRGAGLSIIPRENWFERDFARLQEIARRNHRWLYGNYLFAPAQMKATQRLIALAKESQIPILFVRPQVSRALEGEMFSDGALVQPLERFEREFNQARGDYAGYINLWQDERFMCNTYVDASHMSLDCYAPLIRRIMEHHFEQ